ncbi:TetR/AcrR family transcriptional regulator [Nonomuraea diastatica]|uniref:TetR/AcrR family transcriptional regulator n=1 Tax=Nonomuraea diastatica TaxID=1848329 RepID=A0A4R4WZP6_9ACTN|nr:TetR/AcrR family transcriptional regulator [Nonomuraea diastatica]TDD23232.1 TetR/AcrR family transcriptional regulator [Nonomuraea diastatica]
MARTVNPAAYAARRDAFLDAAQRLIETKGYAQVSVQELAQEAGVSQGAFYHYFDSKPAMLEALIERTSDQLRAHLSTAVEEPGLSAMERLQRFLNALAGWKLARRDLLVAMLQYWYSDDNAVVRQKLRPRLTKRIAPLLAQIVRAGADEGVFPVRHPDQTGHVLVCVIQDLNDALGDVFLSGGTADTVEQIIAAHTDAVERVLGAPAGSLTLVDPAALRNWFTEEP